jgi:hypothetical protein
LEYVSPTTIKNCWAHTKIIDKSNLNIDCDSAVELSNEKENQVKNINNLFEKIDLSKYAFDYKAQEFIELENEISTTTELSDQNILDIVLNKQSEDDETDKDTDDSVEPVAYTATQAKKALETLFGFIEQCGQFDENDLKALDTMNERLELACEASKTQTTIKKYFTH